MSLRRVAVAWAHASQVIPSFSSLLTTTVGGPTRALRWLLGADWRVGGVEGRWDCASTWGSNRREERAMRVARTIGGHTARTTSETGRRRRSFLRIAAALSIFAASSLVDVLAASHASAAATELYSWGNN